MLNNTKGTFSGLCNDEDSEIKESKLVFYLLIYFIHLTTVCIVIFGIFVDTITLNNTNYDS